MIQKSEIKSQNQESEVDSATNTNAPQLDLSKKTTGEKWYGRLKFATGEAFILVATAIIAYWAAYGKKSWYNVFSHLQSGFEKALSPIGRMGDVGEMFHKAAASALVTMHGGNLFSIPMKWFENSKIRMVNAFNRGFGKPGEEKAGQERLKNDPPQTWGDVIKGRLVAFATVFSAFFSADVVGKKTGLYHFGAIEERIGRWVAGMTKKGKELGIGLSKDSPHPLDVPLKGVVAENKAYRFGKILALDIFATTAALIIWGTVSKMSARKNRKRHESAEKSEDAVPPSPQVEKDSAYNFTATIQPKNAKAEIITRAKTYDDSHAEWLTRQEMDKSATAPAL